MMAILTWKRYGGYNCSSIGDKRFSAFNAIMPDGRSIECHYQCDVKGYDPGGINWRLGKGKPPLNTNLILLDRYLSLWRTWAKWNMELMRELYIKAKQNNFVLSDPFATTEINQANALSIILNDLIAENSNPS